MALDKKGMDLKSIRRDQKAIDALPNHGRASVDHSKSKEKKEHLAKKMKGHTGEAKMYAKENKQLKGMGLSRKDIPF